jgi:diaminopimelate decarboxylase/aspartate kinase
VRRASVLADSKDWVVLKFGGTSVSSSSNWNNIAGVVRARIAESMRPVVVHSALSGITDTLEFLLTAALSGVQQPVLDKIEAAHRNLAKNLRIVPNARFESFLQDFEGHGSASGCDQGSWRCA